MGEDLATLIAPGPLPKEDVVKILSQVCHGLRGPCRGHRPSGPEAGERVPRGGAPRERVVHREAARLRHREGGRGSAAPTSGAIGSPLWMAPEQTERNAVIGPPTDIWARPRRVHAAHGEDLLAVGRGPGARREPVPARAVIEPIPSASERAAELGVAPADPAGLRRMVRALRGAPGRPALSPTSTRRTPLSHGLSV